jgi:putative membrane protein
MEDVLTDLVLACLHHLLIFSLVAILATEIATIRPGLPALAVRRLAIVDAHYGLVAALLIVVGVLRVIYGVKGAHFYTANPVFWAKMAAFALTGLLSIGPTMRVLAWRRAAKADPAFVVPTDQAAGLRPFLLAQAGLFVLIPIFAAMMARGVGL